MNPRVKIYVLLGGFVAAWLLLLVVALFPLTNLIKNATKEYRESQVKMGKLGEQWKEIPQLEAEYKRLATYADQLSTLFLDREDALRFIEAIEQIARATIGEFDIRSVDAGLSSGRNAAQEGLGFQVDFEGNFPAFLRFVAALEHMDYLVEIRNTQIQRVGVSLPGQDSSNAGDIRGSLMLVVFTANR